MQVSAFYCRIKALLFKGWIGLRPTTQQLWNMSEHLPESFLCFYKSFTVLKHTACYLFMLQYFFSTQSPCVLNFHFCILQVIKNWRCRRLGNEAADMSTVPLKNSSVRERTWILGTRPGKVCLRNYPVRACAAGVKQCEPCTIIYENTKVTILWVHGWQPWTRILWIFNTATRSFGQLIL